MSSPLCLIFDLDGTLVDSEALCNRAFIELLPRLNETVEELTRRYRGMKLALILADLSERLSEPLAEGFEAQYRQRVAELFERELRPVEGVHEMLEVLRTRPYALCVASSGPRAKIEQALQVSGIAHYFAGRIFSSYEVGAWKPDPGLFLHTAQALHFEPNECLVVEDSEAGVAAALAARMHVFRYAPDGEVTHSPNVTPFRSMALLPHLLEAWQRARLLYISTPRTTG